MAKMNAAPVRGLSEVAGGSTEPLTSSYDVANKCMSIVDIGRRGFNPGMVKDGTRKHQYSTAMAPWMSFESYEVWWNIQRVYDDGNTEEVENDIHYGMT
jgi:hypothetical protein